MCVILNEREYAEKALLACELGSKPTETIGIIAKYYTASGYKNNEVKRLVEEFMMKCEPGINIVKWQNTLNRNVRAASRCKLIEIEYIPVTQRELDICASLPGRQMQRLLFTLICLAKFGNATNPKNNNWANKKDGEIFKMANIVTTSKRQSLMLNDLREMGLIGFSKKVDNVNINVQCLDYEDDPMIAVTDFRNLGYQYTNHVDGGYMACESCGLTIKKANNRHKCCPECAKKVNASKTLERYYRS